MPQPHTGENIWILGQLDLKDSSFNTETPRAAKIGKEMWIAHYPLQMVQQ